LIAWNGKEEILLLQTRVRVSQPTRLLEVLPLPAEPRVTKGDRRAFRVATQLLNAGRRPRAPSATKDLGDPFSDDAPAAVVTQVKTIGAHQINVVKVLRGEQFAAWVTAFLAKRGVSGRRLPPALLALIDAYLADGLRWFVFDVIEAKTRLRSVAPISYRFASERLYYPLRISRLAKGRTRVRLLALSPRGVRFAETRGRVTIEGRRRRLRCWRETGRRIRRRQLARIGDDFAELLGDGARLSLWRCSGHLAAATFDLLGTQAPPGSRPRSRPPRRPSRGQDLVNPFQR
jgi:hypothetical protein